MAAMSIYQQTQRLMRWRTYVIAGVILVSVFMTFFGQAVLQRLIRPCAAPPAYAADVPVEVRARIDALQAAGLLYCTAPVKGLANVHAPVYWGSDGLLSVLFFQADSLDGIGVVRYGFGRSAADAYVPVTTGGAPVEGFREDVIGRAAITNQAPAGARFFYRVAGAPADNDSVVAVTLRGQTAPQPGLGGRDAFQDIERAWDIIRRRPPAEVASTDVQLPIAVVSDRWREALRRDINPALRDAQGQLSVRILREIHPQTPVHMATLSGPLATTIWVVGVISGTRPALVIAPSGGPAIEPIADSAWVQAGGDLRLHHFAFAPQAQGTAFEARYWHAAKTQSAKPADYTWPITIP
jgi:hypothetical protein